MTRYLRYGLVALCIAGSSAQAYNTTAVNEVLKLKNAGLGDDSIVSFVNSKNINYDLSADDTIALKNQGISSAVLSAMLSSGATVVGVPSVVPATPVAVAAPTAVAAPAASVVVVAPAQPTLSPDAAYFYSQLSPYGNWILGEDNQWYWQPSVAVSDPSWRPYWNQGHWVYTDSGWYWTSDYAWGWAPFHYGRWQLHPLHGWIWAPDRVWSPAWVVWRNGGDYAGWAPLPPGSVFNAAGVLTFRGATIAVDFDFGLDWRHFNFCYLKEMGSPMRAHWTREVEIRGVFGHTTIANGFSMRRDGDKRIVVNHGIDPSRVAAARGHDVVTAEIHDLRAPAKGKGPEHLSKDNHTLEVYRPQWNDGPHR